MGLGDRSARRHETIPAAKVAGVDPSLYWAHRPGDKVMTVDGFPGRVVAVNDGPHAGNEDYEVLLDNGLGGGTYVTAQLTTINDHSAAQNTASIDYPELAEVLDQRKDPAKYPDSLSTYAALHPDDDRPVPGSAPGIDEDGHLTWGGQSPAVGDVDNDDYSMLTNPGDHKPHLASPWRDHSDEDDGGGDGCEYCGSGNHDTDEHEDEPEEDDSFVSHGRQGGYEASHGGEYLGKHDTLDRAIHSIFHAQHQSGYMPNMWMEGEHGPSSRPLSEAEPHYQRWAPNLGGKGPMYKGAAPPDEHDPIDQYSSEAEVRQHLWKHHDQDSRDLTVYRSIAPGDPRHSGKPDIKALIDQGVGQGVPSEQIKPTHWESKAVDMSRSEMIEHHADLHDDNDSCHVDHNCPWTQSGHTHKERDTSNLFDPKIFGTQNDRDLGRQLLDEGETGPTKYSTRSGDAVPRDVNDLVAVAVGMFGMPPKFQVGDKVIDFRGEQSGVVSYVQDSGHPGKSNKVGVEVDGSENPPKGHPDHLPWQRPGEKHVMHNYENAWEHHPDAPAEQRERSEQTLSDAKHVNDLLSDVGGGDAEWALSQHDREGAGPSKYSKVASADEYECGTDHWPRHTDESGKTWVGGKDALGDSDCGHPKCPYQPCDHEWCKGFPEGWHTKVEHIDPADRDPYSDVSRDAEKSMQEAFGGDDHVKDAVDILDTNHEGPSKYSSHHHKHHKKDHEARHRAKHDAGEPHHHPTLSRGGFGFGGYGWGWPHSWTDHEANGGIDDCTDAPCDDAAAGAVSDGGDGGGDGATASLFRQANEDADFGFHVVATWFDVRAKAKRIRADGKVSITANKNGLITATVQGDHHTYESSLMRVPGTQKVGTWDCGCFLADAPIAMSDGTEKPISLLQPGDLVISHTGHIQPVVKAWSKPYTGGKTTVSFVGDYREYVSTSDHKVWAQRDGVLGWYEIGTLSTGDRLTRTAMVDQDPLVVSIPKPQKRAVKAKSGVRGVGQHQGRNKMYWIFRHKVGGRGGMTKTAYFDTFDQAKQASDFFYADQRVEVKVDEDLAWLLGWYLAEGHARHGNYEVGFTLSDDEGEIAERLSSICWNHFGQRGSLRQVGSHKLLFRVSSWQLHGLVTQAAGRGSHDKRLSPGLMSMPLSEQAILIRAWLYGDGCYDKTNGSRAIDSVSEPLLRQGRELLLRMGFCASVRIKAKRNDGGLVTTQGAGPIYTLKWSPDGKPKGRKFADGMEFISITSMKTVPLETEVWDVEVDGDHSFRAFGVNVHNCKWGAFHWGRSDDLSRFAGRMCSHALATHLEAQSRGMFGREVAPDQKVPRWITEGKPVVTQYDIDTMTNRTASLQDDPSPLSVVARMLADRGEDPETILSWHDRIRAPYLATLMDFRREAAVSSPFGEPTPTSVLPGPGPTKPRDHSENPASAGFLTQGDPGQWDQQDPVSLGDRVGALEPDEALFEPQMGHEGGLAPLLVPLAEALGPIAEGAAARGVGMGLVKKVVPKVLTHLPGVGDGDQQQEPAPDEGANARAQQEQMRRNYAASLHDSPEPALPSTDGGDDSLEFGNPGPSNPAGMTTTPSASSMPDPESMEPADQSMMTTGSVTDIVEQFQRTAGAAAVLVSDDADSLEIASAAKDHLSKTAMDTFSPGEQQSLINESPKARASNLGRLEITGTHYESLAALDLEEDDPSWMA